MYDKNPETPEEREAANAVLKNVLGHDGWGKGRWDGIVKNLCAEFGIETDLVELAQRAPCLVEMFQLGALIDNEIIGRKAGIKLREIIWKLVRIARNAETGDERATNQLSAIHKLAHPDNYELPATVIKNLADSYHTSPHLARAWAIRFIMVNLSYIVAATRSDVSLLTSPIRLATENADLFATWESDLYEKASKHIKRNSTLQSLAIDIYIEELAEEGITIGPRELKRDLQKLKEWEVINLTDPSEGLILWNEAEGPTAKIPVIPIYSEGWKQRWKRGDKE